MTQTEFLDKVRMLLPYILYMLGSLCFLAGSVLAALRELRS